MTENVLTINNLFFHVEEITFADIQEGDTIIHLYDDTRNFGPVELWTGVAEKAHSKDRLEWFGPVRKHATQNEDGSFTIQAVRDNDDYGFLIAATWHETEAGHTLYRIV